MTRLEELLLETKEHARLKIDPPAAQAQAKEKA